MLKLPKYHSSETIKAKVFFEILANKNYTLLKPKPGTKTAELESIFSKIHDEWFLKTDNPNAKDFLKFSNNLSALHYKKKSLVSILKLIWKTPYEIWNNPTVKANRDAQIDMLNKHFFTPMNKDGIMIEEIDRAMSVEIGIIENDISENEIKLKSLIKESTNKVFDYYDSIVQIGSALPGNTLVKEDMSLAIYMAVEKMAIKVSTPKPKAAA